MEEDKEINQQRNKEQPKRDQIKPSKRSNQIEEPIQKNNQN